MNVRLKFSLWVVAFIGCAALFVAGTAYLVGSGMSPGDIATLRRILEPRAPVFIVVAVLPLVAGIGILGWIFRSYVTASRSLAEQTRIVFAANSGHRVVVDGASELAELAVSINRMADAYHQLRTDLEARVAASGARLEEERNRLATLMSELSEGVLLCNSEGRILLYNEQARSLFGQSAESPGAGRGLVGLGRSVFSLLHRDPVVHALEKLQHSLDQGEAFPATRFVTSATTGALVRVHMAPVQSADRRMTGMILTLEEVTEQMESDARRRALLRNFALGVRVPVASLSATAEQLASARDLADPERARMLETLVADTRRVSSMINEWLASYADVLKAGLALEDMRAGDLLQAARRRIEQVVGLPCSVEPAEDIWIKADSFALSVALAFLAGRLREDYGIRSVTLRASRQGESAGLDLVWSGAIVSSDAIPLWETQPMEVGAQQTPLTLGDVLDRHGGEMWSQAHKISQTAWFRLILPLATPARAGPRRAADAASRPEFYDFDLFHQVDLDRDLFGRRLSELVFTAFDTETTGLEPSAGDEIISIGAVRIVNSRLLKGEVFEQLVDPRRPVSAESTRIHGIAAQALEGQPVIGEVLPQFHRFCEDTVLVAHNAAFDMRFLELKEASTGVHFRQPVLDTLLLSAIVHPSAEDHGLAAIAARLGVSVVGRHTALGDALLTGEVFLRMIPLLAELGIATLGQALEASRETYYARLRY